MIKIHGTRRGQGRGSQGTLAIFLLTGLALSLLNPTPAARHPWHDHIVLGASTLEEWAHALASHYHRDVRAPDPVTMASGANRQVPLFDGAGCRRIRVESIRGTSGTTAAFLFPAGAQAASGPDRSVPPMIMPGGGRAVTARLLLIHPIDVPTPDPPPRATA